MKNVVSLPKILAALALAALGATCPFAFAQHTSQEAKEAKEDIQRHRAMSAAHEGAARCLEAGKKADLCEKELLAACKGLAIGKYCGMKHVH